MPPSYQGGGKRVNSDRSSSRSPSAPAPPSEPKAAQYDRNSARDTATFTPYYWEAYNEIVEPRRFDHYLITRWLPALGRTGFALVKLLRDRCYHNPATGTLRDSYEADMDELAAAIGVGTRTLFRELKENQPLGQFVRRIEQHSMVNGRPQQRENLYQVCMDDPIHPDDMQRYDDLRALKEQERNTPPPKKILHRETPRDTPKPLADPLDSYGCHFGSHSTVCIAYERQNGSHKCQNGTPNSSAKMAEHIEDLPTESLTKESLTPHEAGIPPYIPPGGRETRSGVLSENVPMALVSAWPAFLVTMAQITSAPTFHTHIETLVPYDLIDTPHPTGADPAKIVTEAVLVVSSAFTREWIEKRHRQALEASLSHAIGRPVVLRLIQITQTGKPNNG